MQAIAKALDEIKYRIPFQVLQATFIDPSQNWRNQAPISIDEQMMLKVIRPRVLLDCDLVGGMEVIIPLDGINPEYLDNYSLVYKIPDDRVLGRDIVSVLSVGYMPYSNGFNSMGSTYGNISPTTINDIASVNQRLADSFASIPPISNATIDLIGHNTVVIRDQYRVAACYQLRAIVGNEANLNNINPRSFPNFAKLAELAIKSYIYKEQIIKIDQGYLMGGQELGAFKAYVETLSDSEENYQTFLNQVWRKTAFVNDVLQYDRYIKLQINGGI